MLKREGPPTVPTVSRGNALQNLGQTLRLCFELDPLGGPVSPAP